MSSKALVVGCGAIGSELDAQSPPDWTLTHAGAYAAHEETTLVAGVDPAAERRKAFHTQWQSPAYESITDAMAHHSIDIVSVASPPSTHEGVVMEAITTDVDAILCEKPLAETIPAADRIVNQCAKNGVTLAVNHFCRYTPGCRRIRDQLSTGTIGDPTRAVFTYSKPFRTNGSHLIDLARWWFGDISTIRAAVATPSPSAFFKAGNIECIVYGIGTSNYSQLYADVFGTNGSCHLIENIQHLVECVAVEDPLYPGFGKLVERRRTETEIEQALIAAVDDLLTANNQMTDPVCSGREALATLQACEKIEQKA